MADKSKEIIPQEQDYSEWYQSIIDASDLAEHSAVRGSMIIKPHGYAIWENMQKTLDAMFKTTGVENAYFPLLIPESFLKREKAHVEGFSPELAVVTHAGGKKLDEPYVIRPTSETIIYDAFSRWVESYRDLPILINQWANVVRWELRPRLFLRTTEFLWQEGHTAHATEQEADTRAQQMLDVYADFVETYLAIPVLKGIKSDNERFAGALKTYAIEAMMQDGKALQMGTSHNLGQNFAKVFDLKFTDQDGKYQYCWQTSWGVSTRMIGGLIMSHSDNKGLVLPPKIAPIQILIITVWSNENEKKKVLEKAKEILAELTKQQITTKIDERDTRIGEKIYGWEKKGIPVRIEIGPKDIANESVMIARRDTGEKAPVKNKNLIKYTISLLDQIQKNLFNKALERMKEKTVKVDTWEDFKEKVENGNFVLAHWDGTTETEKKINEETKATIRCMPLDKKEEIGKCIKTGNPSNKRVIFAKAY